MFTNSFRLNPRTQHLFSLIPYVKKYKRQILVGTLMVLCTNLTAVISPRILGHAIDELRHQIDHATLFYYAALIVVASLLEGIFRYRMRRILIGVSRYIEYDLRNDLFAHLQSLSPSFYQWRATGDLMSRATNDLSAVRMVLGPGIMYSVNTLSTTVFVIAILISINTTLAALTLIPLLGVSYSVKHFGKRIHQRFEKIQEQFSILTTLAQENVSGIRIVKAYNQEQAFTHRFQDANGEYLRNSLSLVMISGLYSPLLSFLLGLSSLGLLWYGGIRVIEGFITLGDFVAFMAYLAMLTWPTIALGWVVNIFERGSASMGRINQILRNEPEIHDTNPRPISDFHGNIEIRDLNFSYDGSPVLQNVRFRVQAGKTVAIVGSTGSGKSTLVKLLCRLETIPERSIFIDGIDINNIPLQTLRKHIGYVPQDTFLFSGTVKENIAFGRPYANFEDIQQVSRISNIWPEIQDFPQKFETLVGERGITLSGGQKQRIAISRALLINPKILILDDALSSVDTYTEEQILQRLSQELVGRTAILISHRISTVKMADLILVLEGGRIVECGRHEDLLKARGSYAALYQRQLLKKELEVE